MKYLKRCGQTHGTRDDASSDPDILDIGAADASSTTTGNILEFNVNNHNNSDAHIESKMSSAWYPGKLSDITANADVRLKKYCRQYSKCAQDS